WFLPLYSHCPIYISAGPPGILKNPGDPADRSEAMTGSGACAAERAARLVELVVDLVLQEHDRGDDSQGDESHEEDVLHHRRTPLVLGELRLEPCTQNEQVHRR